MNCRHEDELQVHPFGVFARESERETNESWENRKWGLNKIDQYESCGYGMHSSGFNLNRSSERLEYYSFRRYLLMLLRQRAKMFVFFVWMTHATLPRCTADIQLTFLFLMNSSIDQSSVEFCEVWTLLQKSFLVNSSYYTLWIWIIILSLSRLLLMFMMRNERVGEEADEKIYKRSVR